VRRACRVLSIVQVSALQGWPNRLTLHQPFRQPDEASSKGVFGETSKDFCSDWTQLSNRTIITLVERSTPLIPDGFEGDD
jgi:hypothetical protein